MTGSYLAGHKSKFKIFMQTQLPLHLSFFSVGALLSIHRLRTPLGRQLMEIQEKSSCSSGRKWLNQGGILTNNQKRNRFGPKRLFGIHTS
jgi:hypothetical protein